MCRILIYILSVFILLVSNTVFSQTFITVDQDTYELIEDVSYSLYNNKQIVYNGTMSSERATTLSNNIQFDSIVLSKVDYDALGFTKSRIDSVIFLSKKTFYLDEIVIGGKNDKEFILGETNRFIKKSSRPLLKSLDYGLVFLNGSAQQIRLNKLVFYVDKVKLRTAYRVNFMEVTEVVEGDGHQIAEPGELIYTTDTLFLKPKDKGRIEVALPELFYLPATKKMFVWIELLEYYSDTNIVLNTPEVQQRTKLKFQLSKQSNYYARLMDINRKDLTGFLININKWLGYDYVNTFFIPPHKSFLVAPAIILYGQKI
jgi:hypothetical protein